MRTFLRSRRGGTLVLVTLAMVVLLGFAALAIDVGVMLTARNQLQAAVDASALAGASGLLFDQTEATSRAIAFAGVNTCINDPVVITNSDVTFPTTSEVRVQATHPVNLYFARVLGRNLANITADATAAIGSLAGTGNVKPWAIPDLDFVLGDPVVLKAGELGAPGTEPGFFYPVDFPPLNRGTPIPGAQEYEKNILNGSEDPIFVGDELLVEPGNMVGPTVQGINELIAMDPNAYYDAATGMIMGSDFPGFTSPRVCKVPFYDPLYPPDSGKNSVIIIRLGAFFLEGTQGRNVIGRFIEITTSGIWGPGGVGSGGLMGVKLVE